MATREGGCMCGAVRFKVEGEPVFAVSCHCLDCQKSSGAGHVTMAIFPRAAVTITGELHSFRSLGDSGHKVTRHFCPVCGSRLFGEPAAVAGMIGIALTAFDSPPGIMPRATTYAIRKQEWDSLIAGIPAFDRMPPMPA